MSKEALISQIKTSPTTVAFSEVMEVIANHYEYTPTTFTNGTQVNEAGTNEGSCKIFAFAQLNKLTVAETLACFGLYYRDEVLGDPEGSSHGNIRSFMISGWEGIEFKGSPLKESK